MSGVMRLNSIIDGLRILQRYYDDPNGFKTGADHDVLYAYDTDRPVSDADREVLERMGWKQEPDNGWRAFV